MNNLKSSDMIVHMSTRANIDGGSVVTDMRSAQIILEESFRKICSKTFIFNNIL
jgi:hypothetical protein